MEKEKKPTWYKNKIKRNVEYQKNNVKQVKIDLNKKTDADIIEHLEKQPNKQGFIKQSIRNEIKKE